MSVLSSGLRMWNVNIDWNNVGAASITGPTSLAIAAYTSLCSGSRDCVPQGGNATYKLDGNSPNLMNRLSYRRFATYDAMVVTHSVNVSSPAPGRAGCRWYEIRNITSGIPKVYQQSTFAPDGAWRWVGTTAMDKVGNIGLAYTYSGSTLTPGIAYTGRLVTDALGLMTQGETVAQTGTGFQTLNRWGDYATMNVDPIDGKYATAQFLQCYLAQPSTNQLTTSLSISMYTQVARSGSPINTLGLRGRPTGGPKSCPSR